MAGNEIERAAEANILKQLGVVKESRFTDLRFLEGSGLYSDVAGGPGGGTPPELIQAREEEAQQLQANQELPNLRNIPGIGGALGKGMDMFPPTHLLRLLLPEGLDQALTGKKPSGADTWSWGGGGRSPLGPITDPNVAVAEIMGDSTLSKAEQQARISTIQGIAGVKQADTLLAQLQEDVHHPERGASMSPERLKMLENARGQLVTNEITPAAYLSLFQGAVQTWQGNVADEEAEYDRLVENETKVWEKIGVAEEEVPQSEAGIAQVQKEAVFRNRLTGETRTVSLGKKGVYDATHMTPQQKAEYESADRFLTDAHNVRGTTNQIAALGRTALPFIQTLFKSGQNPRVARGVLGDAVRIFSGVRNQLGVLSKIQEKSGDPDPYSVIKIPNANGSGWINVGGNDDGSMSFLNLPSQTDWKSQLENGGYGGVWDLAESIGGTATESAYVAGQLSQLAILVAQARSPGRLSKTATSPRAPAAAEIQAVMREFNQFSNTEDLGMYITGQIGILMTNAENKADIFQWPESLKQRPLPPSPSSVLRSNVYEFYTGRTGGARPLHAGHPYGGPQIKGMRREILGSQGSPFYKSTSEAIKLDTKLNEFLDEMTLELLNKGNN